MAIKGEAIIMAVLPFRVQTRRHGRRETSRRVAEATWPSSFTVIAYYMVRDNPQSPRRIAPYLNASCAEPTIVYWPETFGL